IPADVAPGAYFLGFVIDDGGVASERNETNNVQVVPLTVSTSNAATSQVRGKLFDDANASGVQDAGEAGRAGGVVYVDANQNRRFDAGETTAATDAAGAYAFTSLAPGRYRIASVAPDGWKTVWPSSESGQTVYLHDSNRNLIALDLATGSSRKVGTLGVTLTDLALDPVGNLYGITTSGLYRVNPQTAATTLIGNHGISGGNSLAFGPDGTLFAMGANSSQLFVLNVATGASTARGGAGVQAEGDLAFVQGRLFLSTSSNRLYELNPGTGAATDRGLMRAGDWYGLATTEAGELLGFDGLNYATLSPVDAEAHYRGTIGGGFTAIAGAASFLDQSRPYEGAYVVDLSSGQTLSGRDFAQSRLGELTGVVFQDEDQNTVRGLTEGPIEGWSVYLDLNGDGARQFSEPSGATGPDGRYRIAGLLPGSYTTRLVVPEGWSATAPLSATRTVTISAAALRATADFGAAQPLPPRIMSVWPTPDSSIDSGVAEIRVRFTNPMDVGTLWPGGFPLVAAAGDQTFGNGNDREVRATTVTWDAATNTATAKFDTPLPRDRYRLNVLDVLTDVYGQPLDGEYRGHFPTGNGVANGVFSETFDVTNGVPYAVAGQGTARQGIPLTITVLGGDPDGEPVTFQPAT
ncbi:MAG TPA: SdrD B-like domain-containing protein, partial [Pirellulaceae bacterium]|nr:SdrD B-like domain-containing protein [Pirellulaceae bacterium]